MIFIISLTFLISLFCLFFRFTKDDSMEMKSDKLLKVKVGKILDGDSFFAFDASGSGKIEIRLHAIDCPESKNDQPWNKQAKWALVGMIGGHCYVFLECHDIDCYGRTVATVYKDEDATFNVNERMVVCGHAWVYRRYYRNLPIYRQKNLDQLERWAKKKRVGLWKLDNPIPPWEWRRENESKKSA